MWWGAAQRTLPPQAARVPCTGSRALQVALEFLLCALRPTVDPGIGSVLRATGLCSRGADVGVTAERNHGAVPGQATQRPGAHAQSMAGVVASRFLTHGVLAIDARPL